MAFGTQKPSVPVTSHSRYIVGICSGNQLRREFEFHKRLLAGLGHLPEGGVITRIDCCKKLVLIEAIKPNVVVLKWFEILRAQGCVKEGDDKSDTIGSR